MFDENKFIYDILNVDPNNKNGYIRIGDLLKSLGFDINYKKSKKHGIVEGKNFKCKNQEGAITLKGKKDGVIVNLIINQNALRGVLKSSKGTIVLNTNDDMVTAQYYDEETTKRAKELKQSGKYGIETTHGIQPDDIVTFKESAKLSILAETLNPKSKTLAKTRK